MDCLNITIEELVSVTGSKTPFGIIDKPLTSVAIDSRKVVEGTIFVGLPGVNVHGQVFAGKAFELGAGAVIVEDLHEAVLEGTSTEGMPNLLVVSSAEKALQVAAAFVRQKLNPSIPVIGVTGSNGKTTTKEVISTVLGELMERVHVSRGNFNNHLGLPVSLLSMPLNAEAAVFELGMSNPGEIDFLGKILKPSIGIITNIGSAHLETMGTIENVAKAKAEIISHLPHNGLLLLNRGCEWFEFLAARHKGRVGTVLVVAASDSPDSGEVKIGLPRTASGLARIDSGRSAAESRIGEVNARFVATEVSYNYVQGTLYLHWNGQKSVINALKVPVSGLHLVQAYLFAILTALELKLISMTDIVASDDCLRKILMETDVSGRMEKTVINGIRIINDGYNANPASVAAAIKYMSCLPAGGKIALGEMLELGSIRESAHRDIAVLAVGLLGKERVFLLGEVFKAVGKELGLSVSSTIDDMTLVLRNNLKEGDTLLLKASRGIAIERVIGALFQPSGEQKLTNKA